MAGRVTSRSLNPEGGFQIGGRGKVDHKDTRFFRTPEGRVVETTKDKAPRTTDYVLDILNDLRKNGVEYDITRVYSKNSRKMHGTADMLAIEIMKPNYAGKMQRYQAWAYYDQEGNAKVMFEGGGNSLLGALKGLDEAMGMRPGEKPLKEYYEEMSLDAQAAVAEKLKDVDWEEVFDDIVYKGDADSGADAMGTYEARDMIRAIMDSLVKPIPGA